ncbi:MAG: OB-fold domain-containing protein [Chloroflexi bacterium]|nr:OB-fold domain-containing protein [Chloroflexota bacterium]
MDAKVAKKVPVVEGLFTWPAEKPQLIGTRCRTCGSVFFPKKVACNNPACHEKKVEDVLLGTRGKLYSFTIQYYPPPPPFRYSEPFTPYGIGLVELPEGVRIAGILTTGDLNEIKIGMDVELVVDKLYEDEEGNEVVTYKFRPVK